MYHPALVFDPRGRLYISIGSASNLDKDSRRARLRRFDLPMKFFTHPINASIDFTTGEVGVVFLYYVCMYVYICSLHKFESIRRNISTCILYSYVRTYIHTYLKNCLCCGVKGCGGWIAQHSGTVLRSNGQSLGRRQWCRQPGAT